METALITGASTGIGYELAHLFAQNHYDLVIIARHQDKLEEMAAQFERKYGVHVIPHVCDLTDPAAPDSIFQEMERQKIHVDVLVNNAGFGIYGLFAASDIKQQLEMVQLNVTALTHLTRLFLSGMVARKSGKILNVASTAAFQPGPLMAVYYATKAYVLFFSEAVANELKGTGVTMTVLCPGPTASQFQRRAGIEKTRLVKTGMMTAAQVARIGYRALMKGQPVVVAGWRNKIFAFLIRFSPRQLAVRIVRALQEERMKQEPPRVHV